MHDMQMPKAAVFAAEASFMHLRVRQAGTKKLRMHFQGGDRVYAASFVLVAHYFTTRKTRTRLLLQSTFLKAL
jgi:hypothetical protein